MLSILIPVYNYSVKTLINSLLNEANKFAFEYEIIVLDDSSSNVNTASKNKLFCNENDVIYIENKTNIGRTATRNKMAEISKYDSLLFLDSDVIPVKDNFISLFIDHINDTEVLCGGINYIDTKPERDFMLRWKYGHKRESISFNLRNKKPYLSIISACFLIKKDLFLSISEKIKDNNYGMDVLFASLMEKNKLTVKHINNPVFHLGLETNLDFIKKSELAMKTIVKLQKANRIPDNYRPIQRRLIFLKKTHFFNVFIFGISIFKKSIVRQLNSKKPNLFIFDIYRLYCLCLHYKQLS